MKSKAKEVPAGALPFAAELLKATKKKVEDDSGDDEIVDYQKPDVARVSRVQAPAIVPQPPDHRRAEDKAEKQKAPVALKPSGLPDDISGSLRRLELFVDELVQSQAQIAVADVKEVCTYDIGSSVRYLEKFFGGLRKKSTRTGL